MQRYINKQGFTIVELLIVVVVIAILAAITIVAYNGIQNRAKDSAFASNLASAAKKLEIEKINTGTDTYPAPGSYTIPAAGAASFTYLLADANTYCITATQGGVSYGLAKNASAPQKGSCVVNLVKNPKGIGSPASYLSSGWFRPLGTTTDATGVSWGSRSDWHRFVWTGSGNGIKRLLLDLNDLQNGQIYTVSVLVANPGASSVSFSMDFSDQSTTTYTVAAGESRRISLSTSRATYDDTFRFIDIDSGPTAATGLLVTDAMATRTDGPVSYGDGDSAGWTWTGSSGLSKSTGPAQ